MRNGPNSNKRMRSRSGGGSNNNNNRRGQNPMTRVFESNGPDIKIRGTASHIAEKYVQLARDARTSGDPVAAENYYQHAEHYFRLIAAAQEQFRQNQPQQQQQPAARPDLDGADDLGDDYSSFGAEPGFVQPAPQPQPHYPPREAQQPYPPREQYQPREQTYREREQRPQPQPQPAESHEVDRLPSFITGGAQPQPAGGFEGGERQGSGERFSHRRRRRPPGPRPENPVAAPPSEDFGPAGD